MTKTDERLAVAIVGLGMGQQHVRGFAKDPRVRLEAVFDLDREKCEHVSKSLGDAAVRIASSYDDILNDETIDIVSIATFDAAHAAQVLAAFEAKKHVFCEKPLCRTAEELSGIARAQRANRRALMTNLVLRTAPLYTWLDAKVASGDFGDVYSIEGEYRFGRIEKITEGWRSAEQDYSVMLGGGVHMVDLMLGLARARPNTAFCRGNRIATHGTAFRYNDFSSASFEFESGLIGQISANFGCVAPHQHALRVFGTKRTLLYDDAGARLFSSRDPAKRPEILSHPALPATKSDLISVFLDRIFARDATFDSQREFDVIAACIAADASMKKGLPVSISYP